MKKALLVAVSAIFFHSFVFADKGKGKYTGKDSLAIMQQKLYEYADSVTSAMKYQTGTIILPTGIATLKVPAGFKYLNKDQSNFVISDVWGNPKQDDILGMLFPENGGPFADSSYAYVISFNSIGYVKDEEADEIDYDEMLKELQESEAEENKQRVAEGYEPLHIVGWAQKPFYDKTRNVLHWAKEIRFGTSPEENTLNYDVRFLGRKGVLSFNAVAGIGQLNMVKQDISKVLEVSDFTAGNKYSDFDSNIDNVAAYGIGGLVAGKVLMKAGFFVVLLKFWKLIAAALVGAWYAIKRFFIRKKQTDEVEATLVEEPAETVV